MNKDRIIVAYQKAINSIDDYFEYASDSSIDRSRVHRILSDLSKDLVVIKEES